MGNIGRKDLSLLIVPRCLRPQALCRDGVLFLLWFPHHGMWFPSREHVCQSTGIWAQVLWSLPAHLQVPALPWDLAQLQSTFVLVYMCFLYSMYIIPVPAQIPRCKMETTQIQILKLIKYWPRNNQKIRQLTDYFVFLGAGSQEWKWPEWKPLEDFVAWRTARGYCSSISTWPVHVFTGMSITQKYTHKACQPYVTKSSHVHNFQHKYYCLNSVTKGEICKPSEVLFSCQWCKYCPSSCTPVVWLRTMCLVKWASVYLLWSGKALARHWPKPLVGRSLTGLT